jgi:hypothetical protein
LNSRQRHLVADSTVGRVARYALAGQRRDPSRWFRRRGLEQVRIDYGSFTPPRMLDEAGLL